jgi:hypothetical protein
MNMGIIAASRLRDGAFPTNLFKNGQRGAFYDPSDLSTLFQDSSGNTPVTSDGDPVGLMLDKSGNDNHAFQTDNTSRPVYKTDGNLHWIFGDGSNHFLITDEIAPIARDSTGLHFSMAAKSNQPPLRVSQYSSPTNSRNFSTVALGGNLPQDYYAGVQLASSFQIPKLAEVAFNINNSHVFSFKWEGPNSYNKGQLNNETVRNSPETLASVGTFTSQPLEIFSINNGTLLTEGRVYGIFVIGDVLTETQSNRLKEYMASKGGVTL